MDKETFSQALLKQKEKGNELLAYISNMHESQNDFGDGMAIFGRVDLYSVPEEELDIFRVKFNSWKNNVDELLKLQFGSDDQYVYEWNANVSSHVSNKKPILSQLKKNVNVGLTSIDSFIGCLDIHYNDAKMNKTLKQEKMSNHPKVFISHKKEDKDYADALLNMINFIIGSNGDKIFCSSVPGYGIKQSHHIMDALKAQFDNNDIFMVIIHSPRYYHSAICLNEMGAAWVLGTRFCSFLTKDCKSEHLRGVINNEKIYIDPNDDPDQLNAHLNDFKNDLVEFFGCIKPDENKWENARSRFIKEISTLTYGPDSSNDVDEFEVWYLPAFNQIFKLLDIDNFQRWAYPCAIAGNTVLKANIYENLEEIPNYILGRPKRKKYQQMDSLMRNLGLLISDFAVVYSQHAEKLGNSYIIPKFYKRIINNPKYEEDLAAYTEYTMLISDMLFELTRLCNLILSRIREICTNYRTDIGLLHIDNQISAKDLVYNDTEISDNPYPGLKEYIKVRLTRETHFGNNPYINESGYTQSKYSCEC